MIYFTGDIHGYPWDVKKFCTKMKLTEEDTLTVTAIGQL